MTEATQTLNEMKELYTKILGEPAPDIGPGWYAPFPLGVDPLRFAAQEVHDLRHLQAQIGAIPGVATWIPRADMFAEKDAMLIRVEIPGVSKDGVKVHVVEGECIVRGERKAPGEAGGLRALAIETPYGPFERRFALPRHVAADRLVARYAEGVLEVRIPIETKAFEPKELKVVVA